MLLPRCFGRYVKTFVDEDYNNFVKELHGVCAFDTTRQIVLYQRKVLNDSANEESKRTRRVFLVELGDEIRLT